MTKELVNHCQVRLDQLIAGAYTTYDVTIKANEKLEYGTILTRGEDGKYAAVTKKTDEVKAICLEDCHETSEVQMSVLVSGSVNENHLKTGTMSDGGQVSDFRQSALDNKIYFRAAI